MDILYHHGIENFKSLDCKIVLMGNSGVGKTSLLQRYTQNKFDPKNIQSTSGAFFVSKKVHVRGMKVRLQLWDTAGQERFRSMAPMYYRGAHAALLLYDITNVTTFEDIRGWLEELKKNCPPELIIYIVGAKADLHIYRQVSTDFARLSLSQWFPTPKKPPPPPEPIPQSSTLSYIRPRFTSFPGLSSPPSILSVRESPAPYLDLPSSTSSSRRPRTPASPPAPSRFGPSQPHPHSTSPAHVAFSHGIEEFDGDPDESSEWGLSKHMNLFEVSAKDDVGIRSLFEHLISAIILRKDHIEELNSAKKRDSVALTSSSLTTAGVPTPTWSAQADEYESEAREKAVKAQSWTCC